MPEADRSFLPQNRSTFEHIESLTSATRRPLHTDLIKSLWNPTTCPLDLLPYLAWGLGLEIWDENWGEAQKREIVANIWSLKRQKTTLAGIRAYVNLVGANVVKAVRPRDKMWLVPSMSEA